MPPSSESKSKRSKKKREEASENWTKFCRITRRLIRQIIFFIISAVIASKGMFSAEMSLNKEQQTRISISRNLMKAAVTNYISSELTENIL